MAKKKRSKKSGSPVANSSRRPDKGPWSDLEQTFFAAAPPDEAGPVAEAERFDDLDPIVPPRQQLPPGVQRLLDGLTRLVAAVTAPRLDLRTVTIAIASLVLLIGLSAAVFASHH